MCRKQGRELTEDDVRTIAKESWPENARGVTIENVQKYVEKVYDVSHEDLVGPKRVKEIMMTRHVAIWLCRHRQEVRRAQPRHHQAQHPHR